MSFLLDTNVISEVRRARANPGVRKWFESVPAEELFLSTLVVGEVLYGIEKLRRRDPVQAEAYEAWLATLHSEFSDRLLPISSEVAERWGRLNVPDPVPVVDGLLAATAQVHGLTLVTRNTADLARTGVSLLNPFSG